MHFNNREEIIALTPFWKGERMPDGRPRVEDRYLDALRQMTLEEVWKPIFLKGYENQFTGGGENPMYALHGDGRKLVGRAVTCSFCPMRPDLHAVMSGRGEQEGRKGTYNQWVIDSLQERDVVVADMYDKIYKGTFLGGNLTTAIRARTGSGGAVIWGGIRDLEQMKRVEGVQVYYRGIDPTPIREFIMTGFNSPVSFGGAVCMPGDVVFGAGGGVLFIPAHLVAEVVEGAAKTHAKDNFGFEMIAAGRFTAAQIDRNIWTKEMLDMLTEWIRTRPEGEPYRRLDWSTEYEQADKAGACGEQSAL